MFELDSATDFGRTCLGNPPSCSAIQESLRGFARLGHFDQQETKEVLELEENPESHQGRVHSPAVEAVVQHRIHFPFRKYSQ